MFENTVCSICDLHFFFLSLIFESRITFVLANQCYNYVCVMKSGTYFAPRLCFTAVFLSGKSLLHKLGYKRNCDKFRPLVKARD